MINAQSIPTLSGTDEKNPPSITIPLSQEEVDNPIEPRVIQNATIAPCVTNKIVVIETIETQMSENHNPIEPNQSNIGQSSMCSTSDSNNGTPLNGLEKRDSLGQNNDAINIKHLSPIVLSPCRSSDSCSDEEYDEIGKMFETKSLAIEKWLRDRAPPDVLIKIHAASDCSRTPKSPQLRTASITSDLFQQWLATSPVQVS